MADFWMIRAGEGGYLASEFVEKGCVAVGFDGIGDFAALSSLEALRTALRRQHPDKSAVQIGSAAGVANKFRSIIRVGDRVVTYDPATRLYHLGELSSEYEYRPGFVTDYAHIRRVNWTASVSRDSLKPESRNSLGSTITIFEPGEAVLRDLMSASIATTREVSIPSSDDSAEIVGEVEQILNDQLSRAHEFIKDRINRLEPRDMEQLAAALLRALGFRTSVTPVGPDRGRDVIASVDGLGLQPPRILCEVKHRRGQIGAPDVRSFVGGLRNDDRGLFLSTGGFSREARYEADRAPVPVSLLDLDELALLVVEHYEQFDPEGRALIPLRRFYWPLP
jgi:restriction system protein